jgi:hypothetical protein
MLPGAVDTTIILLQCTNGPNKLEHLSLASLYGLIGLILNFKKKLSVVNTHTGTINTTLYFLINFQMNPIS